MGLFIIGGEGGEHRRSRVITTNRNEMQIMYKALNSCYLKTGPHTDTHTQKWTPMVFIEVFQLEERELETRAYAWTCPPCVVFDDPARRDSNPQHDATPSTRDGGKASDARHCQADQTTQVDLQHLKSDHCQADQTRRVDLRHLEPDHCQADPEADAQP